MTGLARDDSGKNRADASSAGREARWARRLAGAWSWAGQSIFSGSGPHLTRGQAWFQRIWVGGLLLVILGFWAFFLNFGEFIYGVQDWIWEWRYARILQLALLSGRLPLHTEPAASYGVDRFLAIPDVPLGPQLIFLRFVDLGPATLATMLLMVLVGYIGCLAIRRHDHLSPFSFTALAVLVSFNGFIIAHLGIGHTLFSGYFVLPFFILLVLQLVDGVEGRGWVAWMGLVLFGIELQGSTQIYAMCMIFLGFFLLAFKGRRWILLKAMLVGVVVNLYRVLPAMISLSSYANRPQPGFISLTELAQALLQIVPPARASKLVTGLPLGWWELDVFVGILGLAFLVYFGILRVWTGPARSTDSPGLPIPLGLSLLILGVFSIGYVYWPINYLPIPLLSLVHVPSRFMILPLLFLSVLAARALQRWLDERNIGAGLQWPLLAALILLSHDLLQHARLWRVEHVFEAFVPAKLDTSLRIVARTDPAYVAVLAASAIVSAVSVILCLVVGFRRGRAASVWPPPGTEET